MEYLEGKAGGRRLFQTLLAMAEREQYDDAFLAALVAYRERYPQSEKFDIFFGHLLLLKDPVQFLTQD